MRRKVATGASPQMVWERLLHNEPMFVLDVRNPDEAAQGMIKGALLIPDEELQARMQKSDQDKASIERRAQESALIAEMGDLLQACRTADEAYPIIARYASPLLQQPAEFGHARVRARGHTKLLEGIEDSRSPEGHGLLDVWMSHGDKVTQMPQGFVLMASTESCPIAAMADDWRGFYGVQWHPECTPRSRLTRSLMRFFLRRAQAYMRASTPPPYPPGGIAEAFFSSGSEATIASVVSSMDPTLAAFSRAHRTTFVGSTIPALTRSVNFPFWASNPKAPFPSFTFSTTTDPSSPAFCAISRRGSSRARLTMFTPIF